MKKIAAAGLVGRGGAAYPTASKWAAVKGALKGKKIGYIIVNAGEGEPGVKKDAFILRHYPSAVIDGVYRAEQFFGPEKIKEVYFFLSRDCYQNYGADLKQALVSKRFKVLAPKVIFKFKPKSLSYLSGEETALLNFLQGEGVRPRLKPPYPTEHGLFGRPTLISNVETFYDVSLAARGKYQGERFYTLGGALRHRGVYALPADLTINEILRRTGNYPPYKFFVQVGGEACGEFLNAQQLERPITSTGAVIVYKAEKTKKEKLVKYWLNFYHEQSCGYCTSCREGTYRLWELIKAPTFDQSLFDALVDNLFDSSFCPLGASLALPVKSYFKNILKN